MRKVIPVRAQSVLCRGIKNSQPPLTPVDHLSRTRVQNSCHAATVQGGASQTLDYFSNCGKMEWSRGKRWLWWITWLGHLLVYLKMGGSQSPCSSQNRIYSFSLGGHVILYNYRLMLCSPSSWATSVCLVELKLNWKCRYEARIVPVEAPVVGNLWGLGQLGTEGSQEIFLVSQSFRPRGAVRFGDYCCVEFLMRNFLQRTRIS